MGVVRERGRKSEEDGESQAVLGTGDKAGQPQRPDIQSNQRGQGEGPWGLGGSVAMGRAAWEVGSNPLPFLLCRGED